MRVLVAAHHYPPRYMHGAELVAQAHAELMRRAELEVEVVCVDAVDVPGGLSVRRDSVGGIEVQRLVYSLDDTSDWVQATYAHPAVQTFMDELLRSGRFDLVFQISGYLLGLTPIRAARSVGLPIVVVATDFWFLCPTLHLLTGRGTLCVGPQPLECARCLLDRYRRYRLVDRRAPWLVERWLAARSSHLPGQAKFRADLERLERRRDDLREALNSVDAVIARTRFLRDLHVRNGIDPDVFKIVGLPPRQEPVSGRNGSATPGSLRIGYVGQIAPGKGVDVLVRAFRRLNAGRESLELVIYGDLTANTGYVQRLRRLAGRDRRISFAGRFEPAQRAAILAFVDLLVVPSLWYENAPLVLDEAFEAGLPVVASRLGGLSEVVRDGVDGLLFEAGDVGSLAATLQRLIDQPGLLRELQAQVRRPLRDDERFPEVLALLESLLGRRTTQPNIPAACQPT